MPHRITILNTCESYACVEENNLLEAMEQLRRKGIPVGCRNGGCGVCKVKVVRGEYARARMSRAVVSEEEEKLGYALACKVQPRSDMEVKVVGKMVRAVEARRGTSFSFEFGAAAWQVKQSDKEN
jgi:ferredoxin